MRIAPATIGHITQRAYLKYTANPSIYHCIRMML